MAFNLGSLAQGIFGRDITPGFNITANAGGGIPFISKGNGSTGVAAKPVIPTQQENGQVLGAYTNDPYLGGNGQSVVSGGSGGGSAAPDLSGYDQSIAATNNQINSLGSLLNNGLQSAQNAYQTTLNSLNQNKAQTDQVYNQNKISNQQDYVANKNTIKTNTGNTIGSIARLAGTRGASGQSAVDYARLLAAGQGTQQLSGAADTFGKNQQAVDQNYGNYLNAYNTNLKNADLQRQSDINAAQANNASSRANLLSSLADIVNQRTAASGGRGTAASQGYINAAQQAQAEATRYAAPITVGPQQALTYEAPTLASYTASPSAAVAGSQGAASDTVTPILSALLGNDRNRQLIGA